MENCIFCKIINKQISGSILYEDDICIAFLDLSQVTKGHTLVVPKKHYKNILDVDKHTSGHLFEVVTDLSKKIVNQLKAEGVNIVSNANQVAYQTVDHFHIHIIPRYQKEEGFKMLFEDNQGRFDLQQVVNEINK